MKTQNKERKRAGRKPQWPRIRARHNRGDAGGVSYRVDAGFFDFDTGGKGAKRYAKQFATLAEAEEHAAACREKRATAGMVEKFERKNRAVSLANLTDRQRGEILEAYRKLEDGRKGSLLAAVDFWIKHAAPANPKTVADVCDELLTAMRAANRRPATLAEMEHKLTAFRADFGAIGIYGVTTHDLDKWIAERAGELSALTRLHYRRCLHRLFSFAMKRRYCEANPAAALEKPALDEREPEIHRPDEVRAILAMAQEIAPRMIPYLAIGYFAGLRTVNELARLDWREIDLADNTITVSPATAKKRRTRYVTISANLAAWLLPHRETEGRIFYSRRAFRNIMAKLNEARAKEGKPETRWPHNAMRHSFASYHLAAHNDAALTSAQLGHADGNDMLFAHYRKLTKHAVAADFWSIKPATTGTVIQLREAVA